MKTLIRAALAALIFASVAHADPFGTGYLSVTVEQNNVTPSSDFSLFLLKDFKWDIGNCVRLFHRNQNEFQGAGAFVDCSVASSWADYGFGLEWAAPNRDDIITLSNETGWSIGAVDDKGAFLLSCADPRFGSVMFSVSTQSNAVPEGISGAFVALCLGLLCCVKHRTYA